MSTSTIVIVLELDETADCPTGTAALPGGEPRTFQGWLGLTSVIDALARARPDEPVTGSEGEQS